MLSCCLLASFARLVCLPGELSDPGGTEKAGSEPMLFCPWPSPRRTEPGTAVGGGGRVC